MEYSLNLNNSLDSGFAELNCDDLTEINGGFLPAIPVAIKIGAAIVVGVPTVVAGVSFIAGAIDGYRGK